MQVTGSRTARTSQQAYSERYYGGIQTFTIDQPPPMKPEKLKNSRPLVYGYASNSMSAKPTGWHALWVKPRLTDLDTPLRARHYTLL